MSTIFALMRRDLRKVFSNVIASIVIVGLIIIPSLFTWFNVIASWDPFANTANLKVAVASVDEGYQSSLVPVQVNIGDQVLSALAANDQLDWIVTDEDDAIDGTRSGEYYAAIVLPESFSADMLSFYADDAEVSSIAYYTNEKLNALAPKITGQGAEEVSTQISEVFSETLGDITVSLASSLTDVLDSDETRTAVTELQTRVESISDQLRSGAQTADMFASLLSSSATLVDSAGGLVSAAGSTLTEASDAVDQSTDSTQALSDAIDGASSSLADALSTTRDAYQAVADRIDDLYASADSLTDSELQVVSDVSDQVQQQIDDYTAVRDTLADDIRPQLDATGQAAVDTVVDSLDAAISRQQDVLNALTSVSTDIADRNADAQNAHTELSEALEAAQSTLDDAVTTYQQELAPHLDQLAATLTTIDTDVATLTGSLSAIADDLVDATGSISESLAQGQQTMQEVASTLTDSADQFQNISDALTAALDSDDLDQLSQIVGSDPTVVAAALSDPVRIDRTAVFEVTSFGAGMAPLYMIIALWVGALLTTVVIRVDVSADALPRRAPISPTQQYLGRYAIYALVGLAQSTLVTVGLILFVQVAPAHPLLLILAGWVSSLVFMLIMYTAVVALGNAGKALSVLLLVVQISSSGGAYPLELLPGWFQGISQFLPATHAVAAVRAALAGVYAGDYWISLGLLLAFTLPVLLVGLVLRRPLIRFHHRLLAAMESTKLM
ncbi:MAG TPA: YhgE/Pip domain-containing protein [Pseudoclavibacter sp.]|nr:YhgE/Pip domain-containing protein [Pseudoclavibacter sp.]